MVTTNGTASLERLRDWIGRHESREDLVTATPVAAMAATLDRDDPPPRIGDELPPLWHWLYFLPLHRRNELGADGHARLGGFLPPVPLPRRMWAGSRIDFHQPLRVGDPVSRLSRIADVTPKSGRSGNLVFVRVLHEISGPQGLAISEEHDIVYREATSAAGGGPAPTDGAAGPVPAGPGAGTMPAGTPAEHPGGGDAPPDPAWTREIVPDEVLLFRYSALTFNGHRIHYDRPYATATEGYAGLIVHGPLIATLLLEHLRDRLVESGRGRRVTHFEFRARTPIVDTERFVVCAHPQAEADTQAGANDYRLWARNAGHGLCMDGAARVEQPNRHYNR